MLSISSLDQSQAITALAPRSVIHRTSGQKHGPITRLFSPGDLGRILKPFVFLDLIDLMASKDALFGFHPHSGIATITTVFEGDTRYEDSTGKSGVLEAQGVEWMNAGGGVWHTANPAIPGRVRGYQLWIALPEAMEGAEPSSEYLAPQEVPRVGPARVILGSYEGASSPLPPQNLTYLHVQLRDGESWTFNPPAGHDVAWLAVDQGSLAVGTEQQVTREAVVFETGEAPITVIADGAVNMMIGSSVAHPHELVMGYYSVHTSAAALQAGESGIREVEKRLRAAGKI